MPDPRPHSRKRRFTPDSLRILKVAKTDAGYQHFHARTDLQMLMAFLDRFDRLGWFPPVTDEKRRLLAAYDLTVHVVREEICFYEFCSRGARGERDPWVTVFFHVNDSDGMVRICGIALTQFVERRRALVLEAMRQRVEMLDRWLGQHEEI
jgi:hypothetical protein